MAKAFVFLEITDAEINGLIKGIREVSGGQPSRANVHITIRGPYSRQIPATQLNRYERLLRNAPLVLEGFGTFGVGDRFIVYVKVQHPELRRIWWKPDFPIKTFGFNPHITLYEGADRERAELLERFLRRECLKLVVWNFKVTSYVSDNRDLFPAGATPEEPFLRLGRSGVVRVDILNRLARTLRATMQVA